MTIREQDIQLAEVGHRPPTTSGRRIQLFAATKISGGHLLSLGRERPLGGGSTAGEWEIGRCRVRAAVGRDSRTGGDEEFS